MIIPLCHSHESGNPDVISTIKYGIGSESGGFKVCHCPA